LKDADLDILYKKSKDIKAFHSILKDANIYLEQERLLNFSFYEMIEKLILNCKLKEDIYTQFFLDFAFNYSKKIDCNLPSFLRFWYDREDKEAIVLPEGTNAVQIMTIHKSKGLAFNNVIIPFNWEDTSNVNDIWVDSSSYFDNKIPSSLIRSSSNLKYTYFSTEYFQHKNLRLLDNLNKLYVAMTRARDRLYIFSKSFPSNIKEDFVSKGCLNSFLYKYSNKYPIIRGDHNKIEKMNNASVGMFTVRDRVKLDWRDIISLKNSAQDIYDLDKETIKKDWGKLFHKVLADIHYIEEKDKVVDKLIKLGECSKEDYKKLLKSLEEFFKSDDIVEYFNNQWDVKTENEILMPNGKTYIPDRLLFKRNSDEVVVIDYKTGKEREKDAKQILNYSNALMNMGFKNVKSILIYTNKKQKLHIL
jgi:ATP-dependent exoDNAse (exonuclease V) beta subunit